MLEKFNSSYQHLCQQLGDAVLKLEQIQSHIDSLKTKIRALDDAYLMLDQASKAAPAEQNSAKDSQ